VFFTKQQSRLGYTEHLRVRVAENRAEQAHARPDVAHREIQEAKLSLG